MTGGRRGVGMTQKSSPLRSEDVRQKNEKLILRYIQHSNGISQSQIVQLTGLKAPTVLRIFSMLEKNGLIKVQKNKPETDDAERKGRKPVYYCVKPKAKYVIGVEFWSQTAHVLVVDFARNPVYSLDVCLRDGADADEIFEQISAMITQVIEASGIKKERIIGIGVGAPGQIRVDTGEIISYRRIPGFSNYPLGEKLNTRLGLPILVANNAGVIAMNAYRRGVAKESEALFTFFIRHGIGGAFIHRGELFSVLDRTAFEVGHTISVIDGKTCYCGSKGCLEAYTSESAILEQLNRRGYAFSTVMEVEQRLEEGDEHLRAQLKEDAVYLAISAKNILHILAPDGFLVITRFKEISKLYAEAIEEELTSDSMHIDRGDIRVYYDAYNSIEAGYGACDLIFDQYFRL